MRPVTSPQARPVTSLGPVAQCAALQRALFQGCRGFIHYHIGRGRAAGQVAYAIARGPHLLHHRLLQELGYETPDELHLAACSFNDSTNSRPLDVGAVWVELQLAMHFDVKRGPTCDQAALDEATDAIGQFPAALSILLDAGDSLLAVWLLDRPVRLDEPASRQRIEELQRRLAVALNGRVGDVECAVPVVARAELGAPARVAHIQATDPTRPVLPLPGSRNFTHGGPGLPVQLAHASLEHRYSITDIEAALEPKPASSASKKGK